MTSDFILWFSTIYGSIRWTFYLPFKGAEGGATKNSLQWKPFLPWLIFFRNFMKNSNSHFLFPSTSVQDFAYHTLTPASTSSTFTWFLRLFHFHPLSVLLDVTILEVNLIARLLPPSSAARFWLADATIGADLFSFKNIPGENLFEKTLEGRYGAYHGILLSTVFVYIAYCFK